MFLSSTGSDMINFNGHRETPIMLSFVSVISLHRRTGNRQIIFLFTLCLRVNKKIILFFSQIGILKHSH